MRFLLALSILALSVSVREGRAGDALSLRATGHDSRVDLEWEPAHDMHLEGYAVFRATSVAGPFRRLTAAPHPFPVYSDFVGANGKKYYYCVGKVFAKKPKVRDFSRTRSATTRKMTDDELMTSVQLATFRYFWDYGHPVSGMAWERARTSRYPDGGRFRACTSGGTGMGMMAIMVGVDRKFVTRREAAKRLLKMVTFLQEKADRYHGAWPHWMNGETGETIRFPVNHYDDGADLVETSFLIQGMLTVRQYFDGQNPVETELRRRITQLWREVEWDFFLRDAGDKRLLWHWSPRHDFKMNLPITGYNECLITYLLAIASPTHAIPADCYLEGWAGRKHYRNGQTFYGHELAVGNGMGGPLFFTHYSFLGFDPRGWRDPFCNYFENNRNTALVNRGYCIENPDGYRGYSKLVWGLTASDIQRGYRANAPGKDDGTIAPTAAISSMPYTPAESLATMKHFYHKYGDRLWGHFGFHDALNLDQDWFAESYLAIDQGPIVCMIENYRTRLCWRMFMKNPEIAPALRASGWKEMEKR